MIQEILKLPRQPPGLVNYFDAIPLNAPYDPAFGIWREEVERMGAVECSNFLRRMLSEIESVGEMIWYLFRDFGPPQKILPYAQACRKRMLDEYPPGVSVYDIPWGDHEADERLAIALIMYESLIESMIEEEALKTIGETLASLYENKIMLLDIRMENVGIVTRGNKSSLVIADPSEAVFLDD